MSLDILFITLPKMETRGPLIGPYLLKAVCEQAGYSAHAIDFNIKLYHAVKDDHPEFFHRNNHILTRRDYSEPYNNIFRPIVKQWVDEIESYDPKVIGITILSHWTGTFLFYLTDEIKRRNLFRKTKRKFKILAGGPGVSSGKPKYGEVWKEKGIIDDYIEGEGERPIIEYLKDNLDAPGINGVPKEPLDSIDWLPFANYDGVRQEDYTSVPGAQHNGLIHVTGSRGCVKRCTFCNVGKIWPTFINKDGKVLAQEIIHYKKQTGFNQFFFTDSLINGSLPHLKDLATELIKNNANVSFAGQWIARSRKLVNEEFWDILAKAGLTRIQLGVESGSITVRNNMKKGVTNDDVYYTVEQCNKRNINCILLMLVGYPTETEEDFVESLKLMDSLAPFNNTTLASIGNTMEVEPGTPVADMYEYFSDDLDHWATKTRDGGINDMSTRIERWVRLRNRCVENGILLSFDHNERLREQYLRLKGKDIKDMYVYPKDQGVAAGFGSDPKNAIKQLQKETKIHENQ